MLLKLSEFRASSFEQAEPLHPASVSLSLTGFHEIHKFLQQQLSCLLKSTPWPYTKSRTAAPLISATVLFTGTVLRLRDSETVNNSLKMSGPQYRTQGKQ